MKKTIFVALLLILFLFVLVSFASRNAFEELPKKSGVQSTEFPRAPYPSPWYGPDALEKKRQLDQDSRYWEVDRD